MYWAAPLSGDRSRACRDDREGEIGPVALPRDAEAADRRRKVGCRAAAAAGKSFAPPAELLQARAPQTWRGRAAPTLISGRGPWGADPRLSGVLLDQLDHRRRPRELANAEPPSMLRYREQAFAYREQRVRRATAECKSRKRFVRVPVWSSSEQLLLHLHRAIPSTPAIATRATGGTPWQRSRRSRDQALSGAC